MYISSYFAIIRKKGCFHAGAQSSLGASGWIYVLKFTLVGVMRRALGPRRARTSVAHAGVDITCISIEMVPGIT